MLLGPHLLGRVDLGCALAVLALLGESATDLVGTVVAAAVVVYDVMEVCQWREGGRVKGVLTDVVLGQSSYLVVEERRPVEVVGDLYSVAV